MPTVQVAGRNLRVEPLWVRVDRNRTQLAVFVVLFIVGSAALLTLAMVAVPGALIGAFGSGEFLDGDAWFVGLPWVVAACFGVLLLVGAFMAAVQLANAEAWVGARFGGRPLVDGEAPGISQAVADMTLAAGLAAPPQVVVLPDASVNAFAIGTNRGRATIGVTQGLLAGMDADEQRAVIAALAARIVAGDIYFATALAALMGPIKAIRGSGGAVGKAAQATGNATSCGGCGGDGCSGCTNVGDGCSGCGDLGDDGCGSALGIVVVIAIIAAVTYAAVLSAAWIVTLWGRALHRTSHEKSDAEGMLLLKDPTPMLSALRKACTTSNSVAGGDVAYDGIFYVATSGTPAVERAERNRFDRLREVLGVEGATASLD